MSLNDPRWGKEPSGDDKKEESKEKPRQPDNSDEPELREPPKNNKPTPQQNKEEMDIEELWNQFNEKLNSMLGKGKKANQSPRAAEPTRSEPTKTEVDDYDYDEPPPRNPEQFQQPSGGNDGKPPYDFGKVAGKASGAVLIAGLIFVIGGWLSTGFYIVPEGQKGVVTTFGKYSQTTDPGFRWHIPYPVQNVDIVDVSSVRKAEIGVKGTTQRLKEALMLTDDENIVDVKFNVQYRIRDGKGAEEFLFRTRDPMAAVVQTAESAMREVVGRKKMDSVLFESKLEIAQEVQKLMQEMLDRYHSGIQVLSVAIQNAQPPEPVQAAFNDAVKAGQDRERQINEGEAYANDVVPKARGMAERLRQEAEGYKAGVVSAAEGDASRFEQVYEQYKEAPKVTRDRMYVDTLHQIYQKTGKILVDSKSANNLLYLPLDKLIEKSGQVEKTTTPTAPQTTTKPVNQTTTSMTDNSTSDRVFPGRSLSRDGR